MAIENVRRMVRSSGALVLTLGLLLGLLLAASAARPAGGSASPDLEKKLSNSRGETATGAAPAAEPTDHRPVEAQADALDTPVVSTPTYRPPRRGSPRAKVGGAMRGARALPTPLALAPDHLALTISAQPSLFWHIDSLPSQGSKLVFALIDEDGIEPVAEVILDHPNRPGIQRIRLADLGVSLEPGVVYEWTVALIADLARRSKDIITNGYIRRVAEPEKVELHNPGVHTYADLGLWYDALESICDSIDADPADADLRGLRNALLEQAKLHAAIE